MSLGLFTVDDQNHLWFDMDCFLSSYVSFRPKHFVLNHGSTRTDRILLLHTGWLEPVHHSAITLLNGAQPVNQTQVANSVEVAMNTLPANAMAYARVIYWNGTAFACIALAKDGGANAVQEQSMPLAKGDLGCIVVGDQAASSSWASTGHEPVAFRLRTALEFAATQRMDIRVPEIRQTAQLDRCVRSWAYPTELIT